jgi:hypothetical protein
MDKKPTGSKATAPRASTGTVTRTELRETLSRATPRLAADEEKALRMLHGVSAPRTIVLERVGQDHPDTREKLLGIELELLRQWRERQSGTGRPDPRSQAKSAAPAAKETVVVVPAKAPAKAAATVNPRRDRIVQALRSRKSSK